MSHSSGLGRGKNLPLSHSEKLFRAFEKLQLGWRLDPRTLDTSPVVKVSLTGPFALPAKEDSHIQFPGYSSCSTSSSCISLASRMH